MPIQINGYTKHGLEQIKSRNGGIGVSERATQDAFKNPLSIAGQEGGRFKFSGKDAVIVLNKNGRIITACPRNSSGGRQGKQ